MTYSRKLSCVLGLGSLLALSGCGGDGPAGVASTPPVTQASPAPSPVTPANLTPSTSFSNTMQSGNFVTIRATDTSTIGSDGKTTAVINPADTTNYISYDAASNVYTVNSTNASGQATTQAFDRTGTQVVVTASGSPDPTEVNYSSFICYTSGCYSSSHLITHTGSGGFQYTYTAFAAIHGSSSSIVGPVSTPSDDVSVFGFPTPAAAVPRAGSATYTLDLVGSYAGTGTGSVNFGSGSYSFSGTLSPTTGSVQTTGTFQSTGTLASATNGFSGTVSLNVNQTISNGTAAATQNAYTFSGSIGGAFFGPAAQELGGTFIAANTSATSTMANASAPTPAVGAILGHR